MADDERQLNFVMTIRHHDSKGTSLRRVYLAQDASRNPHPMLPYSPNQAKGPSRSNAYVVLVALTKLWNVSLNVVTNI
jgi:hypothetical protein